MHTRRILLIGSLAVGSQGLVQDKLLSAVAPEKVDLRSSSKQNYWTLDDNAPLLPASLKIMECIEGNYRMIEEKRPMQNIENFHNSHREIAVFCLWMEYIMETYKRKNEEGDISTKEALLERNSLLRFPWIDIEGTVGREHEVIFTSAHKSCMDKPPHEDGALAKSIDIMLYELYISHMTSNINRVPDGVDTESARGGVCTVLSYFFTQKRLKRPFERCDGVMDEEWSDGTSSCIRDSYLTPTSHELAIGKFTSELQRSGGLDSAPRTSPLNHYKFNRDQTRLNEASGGTEWRIKEARRELKWYEELVEDFHVALEAMKPFKTDPKFQIGDCYPICTIYLPPSECAVTCDELNGVSEAMGSLVNPMQVPLEAFGELEMVIPFLFYNDEQGQTDIKHFDSVVQRTDELCKELNEGMEDWELKAACRARLWMLLLQNIPLLNSADDEFSSDGAQGNEGQTNSYGIPDQGGYHDVTKREEKYQGSRREEDEDDRRHPFAGCQGLIDEGLLGSCLDLFWNLTTSAKAALRTLLPAGHDTALQAAFREAKRMLGLDVRAKH